MTTQNQVIVAQQADGFKFLNEENRAFQVHAGETVTVYSASYARSLVDDGHAEWVTPPVESFVGQDTDTPEERPSPTAQVKVTKKADGYRFLGPDSKAFEVKAGKTAVVMGGAYAESLITDGLATRLTAT